MATAPFSCEPAELEISEIVGVVAGFNAFGANPPDEFVWAALDTAIAGGAEGRFCGMFWGPLGVRGCVIGVEFPAGMLEDIEAGIRGALAAGMAGADGGGNKLVELEDAGATGCGMVGIPTLMSDTGAGVNLEGKGSPGITGAEAGLVGRGLGPLTGFEFGRSMLGGGKLAPAGTTPPGCPLIRGEPFPETPGEPYPGGGER